MNKIITILMIVLYPEIDACGDYFWRDYNGFIPDDAIPAGNKFEGHTYIGQAYVHRYGIFPGTIIPGRKEIEVACYGVKKIPTTIKILCAKDKTKFTWVSTNSLSYNKDTHSNGCPIIGGYDQKVTEILGIPLGTLHIGRTKEHGDARIGNIAFYEKIPWFSYTWNDEEITISEFEALVYKA